MAVDANFKGGPGPLAQTEIPRNTHVSKKVSRVFLILGAIDSSLQNWGALCTKGLGRSAVMILFGGGNNKQEAPRKG